MWRGMWKILQNFLGSKQGLCNSWFRWRGSHCRVRQSWFSNWRFPGWSDRMHASMGRKRRSIWGLPMSFFFWVECQCHFGDWCCDANPSFALIKKKKILPSRTISRPMGRGCGADHHWLRQPVLAYGRFRAAGRLPFIGLHQRINSSLLVWTPLHIH